MKSPDDLAAKLARQWDNPRLREQRLLSKEAWPLELSIGKPAPGQFAGAPAGVREHIQRWREVRVGEVVWDTQNFRAADEPVSLPLRWRLHKPSEWVCASGYPRVVEDYTLLSRLISAVDPLFHSLLIRQLPQLRNTPAQEIMDVARVSMQLEPGVAQGKPLRALSMGVDSKFFERNRSLLSRMLDLRFANEASGQGLETFLDAASERDHWVLLVPLQAGLLPFEQVRVRTTELQKASLPADSILIVENERCLHQLPRLPDCIAILGAGLDLRWMEAQWLAERRLAYWGDLDTWGLAMLGRARGFQHHVRPLMMDREVFDQYAESSVVEPVPFDIDEVQGLTEQELQLFRYLLGREKGRLEQEFLPAELVNDVMHRWVE